MDGQTIAIIFQSTRLRKPRRLTYINTCTQPNNFNPRGYVSLDNPSQAVMWSVLDFNPRGYVSLDHQKQLLSCTISDFNPRGYVSLDLLLQQHHQLLQKFQSTRLRKPRRRGWNTQVYFTYFNPRGYVSLDVTAVVALPSCSYFNPRGYVSLDNL